MVPGKVVDSRMTRVPGDRWAEIASAAEVTAPRSGEPSSDRGVGTQITMVWACRRTLGSEVAVNPAIRMSAISDSERSSMCDFPAFSPSTTRWLTSSPVTFNPDREASCANGRPTYPRPTTTRSEV